MKANNKSLVKLSNVIGIISMVLLVYWVFIFISITVFGLKVFRENITETFYLSIVGILVLMSGSLIINIMFNLTRIAEKHNQDDLNVSKKASMKFVLIFVLSFPIIFGILLGGDYLTAKKKEQLLISSAKSIIENNKKHAEKLLNYSFTENWILEASEILDLYSNIDKHFPHVLLIVADNIDESQVFLGFGRYYEHKDDEYKLRKINFIRETTKEEREYLNKVFYQDFDGTRFSAHDGEYELFYPYIKDGKKIILYFSDYQEYGKLGS